MRNNKKNGIESSGEEWESGTMDMVGVGDDVVTIFLSRESGK